MICYHLHVFAITSILGLLWSSSSSWWCHSQLWWKLFKEGRFQRPLSLYKQDTGFNICTENQNASSKIMSIFRQGQLFCITWNNLISSEWNHFYHHSIMVRGFDKMNAEIWRRQQTPQRSKYTVQLSLNF